MASRKIRFIDGVLAGLTLLLINFDPECGRDKKSAIENSRFTNLFAACRALSRVVNLSAP